MSWASIVEARSDEDADEVIPEVVDRVNAAGRPISSLAGKATTVAGSSVLKRRPSHGWVTKNSNRADSGNIPTDLQISVHTDMVRGCSENGYGVFPPIYSSVGSVLETLGKSLGEAAADKQTLLGSASLNTVPVSIMGLGDEDGLFKVGYDPGIPDLVDGNTESILAGFPGSESATVFSGKDGALMVPDIETAGNSLEVGITHCCNRLGLVNMDSHVDVPARPKTKTTGRIGMPKSGYSGLFKARSEPGFPDPVEANSVILSPRVISGNVGAHGVPGNETAGKSMAVCITHFPFHYKLLGSLLVSAGKGYMALLIRTPSTCA